MDKKYIEAAREVNDKLRMIPQIPIGNEGMMERLRGMKTWIGLEEVLSAETVKVIRKLK